MAIYKNANDPEIDVNSLSCPSDSDNAVELPVLNLARSRISTVVDLESQPEKQDYRISSELTSEDEQKSPGSTAATTPSEEKSEIDPNLVTWDGPDDPKNPQNFTKLRKMQIMVTISLSTFIIPLASSMFAPGVPDIMVEFNFQSQILGSFVVSIFVLGFVVGPMFIAPLSEMYGRTIMYRVTSVISTGLIIGCGECHSLAVLFVLRFLSGSFGSTAIALGAGAVADIFPVDKRGRYMAIYVLGPVCGPAVGPIIGGFLAAVSWRWIFRVIGIVAGLLAIACFFLDETYAPILLRRKAARLRKETGNAALYSIYEDRVTSPFSILSRSIIRPVQLLIASPVVLIPSLLSACTYGELYLLFTTFTDVFETQYGFSTDIVGLAYIGLGLGSLSSCFIMIFFADRIMIHLANKRPDKKRQPEFRLPLVIILTPFVTIGLLIYGWTADKQVHWIVPIIGTYFVGLGILASLAPITGYLVDSYHIYAASASSACTMIRSLGGAFLPLAGPKMYAALGLGWGNTLLAFITLGMWPVPVALYFYGDRLRKKFQPDFH
ncbi:major facilitator superfamily domain-containing protein [Lipomyces oligophaga]|uniref:major facilitator superfamily domain-containing protein n=1 Tax=Lipomyces oligophaga TaxID=45792 RepID=UPI0034CD3902